MAGQAGAIPQPAAAPTPQIHIRNLKLLNGKNENILEYSDNQNQQALSDQDKRCLELTQKVIGELAVDRTFATWNFDTETVIWTFSTDEQGKQFVRIQNAVKAFDQTFPLPNKQSTFINDLRQIKPIGEPNAANVDTGPNMEAIQAAMERVDGVAYPDKDDLMNLYLDIVYLERTTNALGNHISDDEARLLFRQKVTLVRRLNNFAIAHQGRTHPSFVTAQGVVEQLLRKLNARAAVDNLQEFPNLDVRDFEKKMQEELGHVSQSIEQLKAVLNKHPHVSYPDRQKLRQLSAQLSALTVEQNRLARFVLISRGLLSDPNFHHTLPPLIVQPPIDLSRLHKTIKADMGYLQYNQDLYVSDYTDEMYYLVNMDNILTRIEERGSDPECLAMQKARLEIELTLANRDLIVLNDQNPSRNWLLGRQRVIQSTLDVVNDRLVKLEIPANEVDWTDGRQAARFERFDNDYTPNRKMGANYSLRQEIANQKANVLRPIERAQRLAQPSPPQPTSRWQRVKNGWKNFWAPRNGGGSDGGYASMRD